MSAPGRPSPPTVLARLNMQREPPFSFPGVCFLRTLPEAQGHVRAYAVDGQLRVSEAATVSFQQTRTRCRTLPSNGVAWGPLEKDGRRWGDVPLYARKVLAERLKGRGL